MGVPSFYRWLVNKYPKVVVGAREDASNCDINLPNPNGMEFDNLYLDMNGIIHPCFHPEGDNISPPTTYQEVMKNIFEYIDRLVNIVRPRRLLYLAIDGVAPRAKMNQQRSRRFRTAKENDIREAEEDRLRKQFEMEGKVVLPKQESEVSDSNIITPGTEFMHEVSKALQSYISSRIKGNSWGDIMVILSDANVPGEGEHKVMSFIRKQRKLPNYDPNTRHCLYGLDADLIMLALSTHEPHFSILREDVLMQEEQPKTAIKPFEFLHVWLLREYLELDMKIEDPPENFKFDIEQIIDDFIFMCFFAGNDFLPHMPTLEIHEGCIDLLMTIYKREFKKLGGYLVDINKIGEKKAAFLKLSRVEKFILMVGTYEEQIFKKRSEIKDRKLRRLIRDHEDAKRDEEKETRFGGIESECSSDCALFIKKDVASVNCAPTSAEIIQNTKDLNEELNRRIRQQSDLFKSGDFQKDKIKLGMPGWRERYYKEKFSVEGHTDIESKRKEIVQKYTEGLLWVLQYYFSGVPSWTWFYPYHYGPFASDLKGMSQVRVSFNRGEPFKPFDQLLGVLPPRSANALPDAYAQLMVNEKSNILDFYPLDFEVDTDGKRLKWQGICKLPFIDESRLLAETRQLGRGLSEDEANRNSVKVDTLFIRSAGMLAEKICPLYLERNSYFKFDTSISDDAGGVISLYHQCVGKHCYGIKMFDNLEENYVICLCYELLVRSYHNPGLLSGVKLPEKTIFDADIMETILWHERQRQTYGRFNTSWGPNRQMNTPKFYPNTSNKDRRSFTSNLSAEVSHKGAGVGWGSSGRGKPCNIGNMQNTDMVQNERIPSFSHSHQQFEDSRSDRFNAQTGTRSRPFFEDFRQLRIPEWTNDRSPRPNGGAQFWTANNGSNNQSSNVSYGRGQGGLRHGSNNANSWRDVASNNSLRPQRSGAKVYQVKKDQNRW